MLGLNSVESGLDSWLDELIEKDASLGYRYSVRPSGVTETVVSAP